MTGGIFEVLDSFVWTTNDGEQVLYSVVWTQMTGGIFEVLYSFVWTTNDGRHLPSSIFIRVDDK